MRRATGLVKAMSTASAVSKTTVYPKWTGPSQCPTPVVTKPSVPPPLRPPPTPKCPNALPSRPPTRRQPKGFRTSRHIIPAAFPRTYRESTGNLNRESNPFTKTPALSGENNEDRKKRNLEEAKECVRARFNVTPTTQAEEEGSGLWIAGERWIRKENPQQGDGLTLVLSAANGFTKESWMPVVQRLISSSSSEGRFGDSSSALPDVLTSTRIDEVWFLDDYHHGQSIDLNKGLIGPVHSWLDGGRDISNFIKHILPSPNQLHVDETLTWRQDGGAAKARKVIGLGHSVGGNAMVRAAQLHPELFHALFLVEPMTPPIHTTPDHLEVEDWHSRFWRPVITMRRRTTWKSMSDALTVRSSPFFSNWHDEMFKIWETHHLVPLTSGQGVTLATPSWAEAAVFSEVTGLAEGWDALPELQVPVAFLMAGDARATLGEEVTREMVWRPSIVANERIMDAGHLIVHEKPDEVADAVRRFLNSISNGTVNSNSRSERAKL